ncbi:unnamed protein product [Rangifer tarandus platyrhynchus]|uniref:Uncharacterized protein n=1 Tax=Rangifer tarandus platyrhynchus TaxID=3082113 RepID=A0ABN8Y5B0_RANTA|nr:unnamed protein product [Rangifer tarandus platyrhynchus]
MKDGEQVTNSGSLLVTHMLPHTESRADEKGSLHKTGRPDPEPPERSQLRGCVRHRVSLHLRFLGLKHGSREDILYALVLGNAWTTVSLRRHSKFVIGGERSTTRGSRHSYHS